MAFERTAPEDAFRDLTRTVLRGATTLAVGGAAAIVLLVVPIIVWARFGGDYPLRCSAVAIGSLLLCVAVMRATMHDPPRLQAVSSPASCRSQDPSRGTVARDRRDPSAGPCGPSRCRPRYTQRGARDIACRTATPPLARRSARRRTRP
jgi:hypothetical protein